MKKHPEKKRPIQWLVEANPAEIGEALLAVDPIKAAKVGAYLASRIGPEVSHIVDRATSEIQRNPVGSILKGLKGITEG